METISIISNKTVYTISLIEKKQGTTIICLLTYIRKEKMPLAGILNIQKLAPLLSGQNNTFKTNF